MATTLTTSHASASPPRARVDLLSAARSFPVRPGSQKESALINYLDREILRITRRYGMKFSSLNAAKDEESGYTTFEEVVQDIRAVFEVAWSSGTTHLQAAYLLSLAGFLRSYMPAFPFSTSCFPLFKQFDAAFVSLLEASSNIMEIDQGRTSRSSMSITEKVRIKSLIEDTRNVAVRTASDSSAGSADLPSLVSDESADEDDQAGDGLDEDFNSISDGTWRELSKIYQGTLQILGDSLL